MTHHETALGRLQRELVAPVPGHGQAETGSLGASPSSSTQELDSLLVALARGSHRLAASSVTERIELARQCLEGVMQSARGWVEAGCEGKGIPPGSPCRAEEVATGPLVAARHLRLIIQRLREIERFGKARLPARPFVGPDGRLRVPVVPVKGLFDSAVFPFFRAHTWMQPGVTEDDVMRRLSSEHTRQVRAGISLVLGAGNVSATPATDTFAKVFDEGRAVLLKMHPVNAYLGPIFERAFAPLIRRGFLQIIYGGAALGAQAVEHPQVEDVHITGSIATHDTIVWGSAGLERDQRMQDGTPLLDKPITSELGNVSPWIVVPGKYSQRQLHFQAEGIAASIVNNASFNCAATRVVLTWEQWPERKKFVDAIEAVLAATPERKAYYPGAYERFRHFTGIEPKINARGTLPWTFIRDVAPNSSTRLFSEESFASVCVEVALPGKSPSDFLQRAVEFANDRLWGTLCATITVPSGHLKSAENQRQWQQSLASLEYGSIAINQWAGLMYGLMSPPWGGYPGATLEDAGSGIGWAHNTYLLKHAEKTVLDGPLTIFPKPIWFPSHRNPEPTARAALKLYHRPSLRRAMSLTCRALLGPWQGKRQS